MNEAIYGKNTIEDFTEDFYGHPGYPSNDINSFGFRSDEFITNHSNKHILFSGCSNTFGVGLEKEEGWAWKTYQQINKKEACSGFFNIAVGGTGISHMVINIFKYCKKYGNPNVIFINLSNQNRFLNYEKDIKQYKIKFNNMENFENIKLINYQYYFMLEQYCKSNNIELYSFTWDINHGIKVSVKDTDETTNFLFKEYSFNTFYFYDFKIMIDDLNNLHKDNNDKYFLVARDRMHQGTGYNTVWSNFIYNKYLRRNSDK